MKLLCSLLVVTITKGYILQNALKLGRLTHVMHLINDDERLTFVDVADKPKFGIKSLDDVTVKQVSPPDTRPKPSATFGSLTIEDLKKRMVKVENTDGKPLPQRTEDLNGINPFIPLFSSLVPFSMAFLGYQLSAYLTANFAVSFLVSDVYTVQRIAIVARNIIVGMATLATTFCAVIGVGLLLLGLTVAVGVLKGELDPNKKTMVVENINTGSSSSSSSSNRTGSSSNI